MPKSILAEAVDSWPEDEAFGLYCDLIEGEDPASDEQIERQVAHMHACFARETDSAELIRRFDSRLSQLRAR